MKKSRLRMLSAAAVAALLTTGAARVNPATPTLLIDQDFPDPAVLQTTQGYYAYATHTRDGKIPYALAANAHGPWKVQGDALARTPSWAKPDTTFWAPDVGRTGYGQYRMYFSAQLPSDNRMCVGTATANSPAGPFNPVDTAPLVCPPEDNGDIDPQSFVDGDGKHYLLYKSNAMPTTIWLQEVTNDGGTLVGSRIPLIHADRPEERDDVEAPSLVKSGSSYVLFYSADTFASSSYHTGYATSSALKGPYTKAEQPLLTMAGLNNQVNGPGGADVVANTIFFHGWLAADHHNGRGMYSLPLRFEGGKPQLG
ncbi:beta-xylosidase [Amycolatopsis bartoniae]|uniref:Glycoside hydrolase n=1 Tax=Amycolatopsis bartoniae TaxID=941986 RepID=A0A8H9IX20_9PSEU|nr:glycoside hydrolase family 43 protein [Amycolatopsis bartoniae]MBB2933685.1 beta-xylosidase [Amycolatopsis bartoniae]TVT10843.1 family 43 glycosylhydrolase [Amycolatopsis bartoniae]GHF72343.1 glycoside hydrolase [Amycolatopsis bartoniae]